jgi:hypothetical protein
VLPRVVDLARVHLLDLLLDLADQLGAAGHRYRKLLKTDRLLLLQKG